MKCSWVLYVCVNSTFSVQQVSPNSICTHFPDFPCRTWWKIWGFLQKIHGEMRNMIRLAKVINKQAHNRREIPQIFHRKGTLCGIIRCGFHTQVLYQCLFLGSLISIMQVVFVLCVCLVPKVVVVVCRSAIKMDWGDSRWREVVGGPLADRSLALPDHTWFPSEG